LRRGEDNGASRSVAAKQTSLSLLLPSHLFISVSLSSFLKQRQRGAAAGQHQRRAAHRIAWASSPLRAFWRFRASRKIVRTSCDETRFSAPCLRGHGAGKQSMMLASKQASSWGDIWQDVI
jgi:hypothetical protein